jgi:hypothetical protein
MMVLADGRPVVFQGMAAGQKERAIEIALASRFCDHSKLKI